MVGVTGPMAAKAVANPASATKKRVTVKGDRGDGR
jgi:hypothetical protein